MCPAAALGGFTCGCSVSAHAEGPTPDSLESQFFVVLVAMDILGLFSVCELLMCFEISFEDFSTACECIWTSNIQ